MSAQRIPPEALIPFPTSFTFKAIGHHSGPFARAVHEAVAGALGGDRPVELSTRLSRNGTYLSATCTARIASADELRAVYAALYGVEGVITVL